MALPQPGFIAVDPQAFRPLQASMRGQLLTASDPAYDSVRTVHNGSIDRRPALIARCVGVADVMRALEFGKENSLPIAIRCGGHSVPGFSVCEGGIMIDLELMNTVTVDPVRRTATAQGGANWGQFDHETQAFGLATTGGLVRSTGIAGLTLSGGHGFLMRKHGLACDNLVSARVLTAGGHFIQASADENPDLFWALKGGGGNFGIVTEFQYRLHSVGPVLGGVRFVPFAQAEEVLRFHDEFVQTAPDEVGLVCALATLPDGTKAVVHLACCSGDLEKSEAALRPLRSSATPIADQIQPMPYTAVQSIVENFNPRGMRNYWKMVYVRELSMDAIARLTELYSRVPAPMSHIVVYTLGGAIARVSADSAAVSYRNARHALIAIGMWNSATEDEANITWVREFASAMQPFASGGFYPNYDEAASPDRLVAAFGPEKYSRLAAIKQRYDPANLFRLNQNIVPAAS